LLILALVYLPALVAVIGGIWAIKHIRRPDVRDRPDRPAAIRLIVAVALVGGLALGVLGGFTALIFSGNAPNIAGVLTFGLAAGAIFGFAGTLGYALLARPRFGRIALAGTIVGPALLVGATFFGSSLASTLALGPFEKAAAQHAADVAARSVAVHVAVEAKEVQTARDGTVVAAVYLRVRVSTDVAVSFIADPAWPCFVLFPPNPDTAMYLDTCSPAGSPRRLGAGETYLYSLNFQYSDQLIKETQGTYRAGPPGTWTLRVGFLDQAEREYEVKVPLALP
jgi:hypothetical protein